MEITNVTRNFESEKPSSATKYNILVCNGLEHSQSNDSMNVPILAKGAKSQRADQTKNV
jgi:hypothetical protein